MVETKTNQPQLGTWDKLSTVDAERLPKIEFQVNIPVVVSFADDNPREFLGDTGAYYIFDVVHHEGEGHETDKVIVTSAWTLLKGLKALTPLKGKKVEITKRLIKGKQGFEVKPII